MGAGRCCFIHYVEDSNLSVPLLASEGTFGQDVRDLPRGVIKLDMDPCVKAAAVKQPIERNAMSSGNTSLNMRTSQVEHDFTFKIQIRIGGDSLAPTGMKPLQHFATLHWIIPNAHFM